jgi:hypothetical protein
MILAAVLRPWPSDLMEAHEVSTLVNSPENDAAECIQAVITSYRVQYSFAKVEVTNAPSALTRNLH